MSRIDVFGALTRTMRSSRMFGIPELDWAQRSGFSRLVRPKRWAAPTLLLTAASPKRCHFRNTMAGAQQELCSLAVTRIRVQRDKPPFNAQFIDEGREAATWGDETQMKKTLKDKMRGSCQSKLYPTAPTVHNLGDEEIMLQLQLVLLPQHRPKIPKYQRTRGNKDGQEPKNTNPPPIAQLVEKHRCK